MTKFYENYNIVYIPNLGTFIFEMKVIYFCVESLIDNELKKKK